jgi:hypothetical protein
MNTKKLNYKKHYFLLDTLSKNILPRTTKGETFGFARFVDADTGLSRDGQ